MKSLISQIKALAPIQEFSKIEAPSGVVLLTTTILALLLADSPFGNAGVAINVELIAKAFASPLTWGIIVGSLVIGLLSYALISNASKITRFNPSDHIPPSIRICT